MFHLNLYIYHGAVTIGDIMNERARELYWEEWRNVKLIRVSLYLARSGKPDEWDNT
ncbi:RagB/SusD family nutrient uptake outer membrane protein [Pedobacter panaciterrae]|uniref:RagB/SusD family nutrient uptake outer membrane protein n=1 Tax=Pedobacter panaciterrae TaxID=363849 RepID=UPI003F68C468